jgi:hypothetical protein
VADRAHHRRGSIALADLDCVILQGSGIAVEDLDDDLHFPLLPSTNWDRFSAVRHACVEPDPSLRMGALCKDMPCFC